MRAGWSSMRRAGSRPLEGPYAACASRVSGRSQRCIRRGREMVASPVAESPPAVTSDSARKRGVVVLHGRIVGVPLHPSDIAVGKYCVEAIEVVLPSGADVSDIVNDCLCE